MRSPCPFLPWILLSLVVTAVPAAAQVVGESTNALPIFPLCQVDVQVGVDEAGNPILRNVPEGCQPLDPIVGTESGTSLPREVALGDLIQNRQVEFTLQAFSSNPLHLILAYVDYRVVDVADDPDIGGSPVGNPNQIAKARKMGPLRALLAKLFGRKPKVSAPVDPGPPVLAELGELPADPPKRPPLTAFNATNGISLSYDGGQTWMGGFPPGRSFDPVCSSPDAGLYPTCQDEGQTDPILIPGPCGFMHLVELSFTPGEGNESRMVMHTYRDYNDSEVEHTVKFLGTNVFDSANNNTNGPFLDKPSGVSRLIDGGANCGHEVVIAYSVFNGLDKDGKIQGKVNAASAEIFDTSFGDPATGHDVNNLAFHVDTNIFSPFGEAQGTALAVDHESGEIYATVRHFFSPDAMLLVKRDNRGRWGKPFNLTEAVPYAPYDAPTYVADPAFDADLAADPDGPLPFFRAIHRSNAYPTMLVVNGEVVVAWQERVRTALDDPDPNAPERWEPDARTLDGTPEGLPVGSPRIVMVKATKSGNSFAVQGFDQDGNPLPDGRRQAMALGGFRDASTDALVDTGFRDTVCYQDFPPAWCTPGFGVVPQPGRNVGLQFMPSLAYDGRYVNLGFSEARGYLLRDCGDGTGGREYDPQTGIRQCTGSEIAIQPISPLAPFANGLDLVVDFRAALFDPTSLRFESGVQVSRYPIRSERIARAIEEARLENAEDVLAVNFPCSPDHDDLFQPDPDRAGVFVAFGREFAASEIPDWYPNDAMGPRPNLLEPCRRRLPRNMTLQSAGGLAAFAGDYNEVVPLVAYVPDGQTGLWKVPEENPGFRAAWASNQNQRPPIQNGSGAVDPSSPEWQLYRFYEPPALGGEPSACINPGSRNTDGQTALVDTRIIVRTPATFKGVFTTYEGQDFRAYPLTLTNGGGETSVVDLAILGGGSFTRPTAADPSSFVASTSVTLLPYSSTTQAVYVDASFTGLVEVTLTDRSSGAVTTVSLNIGAAEAGPPLVAENRDIEIGTPYIGSVFNTGNPYIGSVFGQANPYIGSVFGQANPYIGSLFDTGTPYIGSAFGVANPYIGSLFNTTNPYIGSAFSTANPYIGSIAYVGTPYIGSLFTSSGSGTLSRGGLPVKDTTAFDCNTLEAGAREACLDSSTTACFSDPTLPGCGDIIEAGWPLRVSGNATTGVLTLLNIDNPQAFLRNFEFFTTIYRTSSFSELYGCEPLNAPQDQVVSHVSTLQQRADEGDTTTGQVENPYIGSFTSTQNPYIGSFTSTQNPYIGSFSATISPSSGFSSDSSATSPAALPTKSSHDTAPSFAPRRPDELEVLLRAVQKVPYSAFCLELDADGFPVLQQGSFILDLERPRCGPDETPGLGVGCCNEFYFNPDPTRNGDLPSITAIELDCDTSDPNANCYVFQAADLVPSAITVPPTVTVGQSFAVGGPGGASTPWSITNAGNEPAIAEILPLRHNFYLCGSAPSSESTAGCLRLDCVDDGLECIDGSLVSGVDFDPFAAGASEAFGPTSLVIPPDFETLDRDLDGEADYVPGTGVFLALYVDDLEKVSERDENNNFRLVNCEPGSGNCNVQPIEIDTPPQVADQSFGPFAEVAEGTVRAGLSLQASDLEGDRLTFVLGAIDEVSGDFTPAPGGVVGGTFGAVQLVDGGVPVASLTLDVGASGSVSAPFDYSQTAYYSGAFDFAFQVTDRNGSSVVAAAAVTVADTDFPPVIPGGGTVITDPVDEPQGEVTTVDITLTALNDEAGETIVFAILDPATTLGGTATIPGGSSCSPDYPFLATDFPDAICAVGVACATPENPNQVCVDVTITYTVADAEGGQSDSFDFLVFEDGGGAPSETCGGPCSTQGTVEVPITALDDTPTIVSPSPGQVFTVDSTTGSSLAITLQATDPDPSEQLTFAIAPDPLFGNFAFGTVTEDPSGTFTQIATYTANPDVVATSESFVLTVSDDTTPVPLSATVSFDIDIARTYCFNGLLSPWKPPASNGAVYTVNAGSALPIRWQYGAIDGSCEPFVAADTGPLDGQLVVEVQGPYAPSLVAKNRVVCDMPGGGVVTTPFLNTPGNSGFQWKPDELVHQFNYDTDASLAATKCFLARIHNLTTQQVDGDFVFAVTP